MLSNQERNPFFVNERDEFMLAELTQRARINIRSRLQL